MEEEAIIFAETAPRRCRRHRRRPYASAIGDNFEARRVGSLVRQACNRVLAARGSTGPRLRAIFDCLVQTCEMLGKTNGEDGDGFDRLSLAERRETIARLSAGITLCRSRRTSGLDRRIDFLTALVDLSKTEARVFAFLTRYQVSPEYRVFRDFLFRTDHRADGIDPYALSLVTGIDVEALRRVIDPGGRLVRLGLLEERDSYEFDLPNRIKRFLQTNASTPARMRSALLPIAPASSLSFDDFEHLKSKVADALELVRHSSRTGERANLLFYGVPGTGKTELARLLAREVGVPAIEVGNSDEDGDEPGRSDRLLHLRLCRGLSAGKNSSILLIDEAEDLFQPQGMHTASKLWLNRLVEQGRGVHIWIANSLLELGEPVVRRMDFAIRFTTPSSAVQERIAEKAATRRRRRPADAVVRELASLKTSPAILASASRTADRIGFSGERVIRIARDLARATGRYASGSPRLKVLFDPALSRADHDLIHIGDRLSASEKPWSILLRGSPGTGKSAFAHHLARLSGRDLIVRSGSSILGPYVGQTEQAIAAAFEEAQATDGILLIDEADDFLADRKRAQATWEASMVNEMLRQMESSRARFIATTNRSDMFDPATARRFSLSVEFLPMTAAQARAMFEAIFGRAAPSQIDQIGRLTPGDFAQARDRAVLLGCLEPETICGWLEAAASERGAGVRAGF